MLELYRSWAGTVPLLLSPSSPWGSPLPATPTYLLISAPTLATRTSDVFWGDPSFPIAELFGQGSLWWEA